MSLHSPRSCRRSPRGASLPEYALLLFLMIGGTAAAVRSQGQQAKATFEIAMEIVGGGSGGTAGIGIPEQADGGSN